VLLGAAVVAGCGDRAEQAGGPKPGGTAGATKAGEEGHPEAGPHGGPLAEWGEEKYHAEFTVDRKAKRATVYVLDGTARKAAPIPAEEVTLTLTNVTPAVQVALKADPQAGDPRGQASRFSGTHEALGRDVPLRGEISGDVAGTPYVGAFDEKGPGHDKK
jgi:hypothetical protein